MSSFRLRLNSDRPHSRSDFLRRISSLASLTHSRRPDKQHPTLGGVPLETEQEGLGALGKATLGYPITQPQIVHQKPVQEVLEAF